ncbi:MAG: hypothetical protein BJG00_015035 [Limnothrix sp. CACIAM 69d]|nr:MAG: hypothetical protein BJG00_015035 [Limnothrix sp. CACIAM 69d]
MPRHLPAKADSDLIDLTPEEAIIAIGLITMIVDESVEDIEAELLADVAAEFELFEDYSDDELVEIVDKVVAASEASDAQTLLGSALAVVTQNEDLAEIALITAILIVAADGEVPESEEDYLNELQTALGVSDDRANEIVEALFSDEEDFEEDEEEEEA